jgi:F420-0:gamma-glutamyl ligase-like protein
MLRVSVEAVETDYWMPGDDYLEKILKAIEGKVSNGDVIVISEKAISVAKGLIIDEEKIKPSFPAYILARFWMRIVWGYFLGRICSLKEINLRRLRNYPLKEGAAHKEIALRYAGFLNALMWGSEGGIDGSNLPYAYVSLPLEDPQNTAEAIYKYLKDKIGKNIIVMIADTDKTYSFRNFHFTHRPKPMKGIHPFFGFIAYVIGRSLKLKRRSTPLALVGAEINVNLALDIAEVANKARGYGAGRTVWDMAEKFNVGLTKVTWDMLRRLKHKPIVIIRFHN